MNCPVCGEAFEDSQLLELHVNAHFDAADDEYFEDKSSSLSSGEASVSRSFPGGFRNASPARVLDETPVLARESVGDVLAEAAEVMLGGSSRPSRPIPRPQSNMLEDGRSCTIDPLSAVKRQAGLFLCSACDHYASSGRYRGFACGFRNIQVLLSALMRQEDFKEVVFNGKKWMPSVPKIQALIEEAWRGGFDNLGSIHFSGVLQKTRRWIGATEVASLFSSMSIRCRLVEFRSIGASGYHDAMFAWLLDHFREGASKSFLCPVYLQHDGHSRCVVGVDERRRQMLLFDPSVPAKSMRELVRSQNSEIIRAELAEDEQSFDHDQYQLAVVEGIMESEQEFENSKVMENICLRIN